MLAEPLLAQNGGFPVVDRAFHHPLGDVLMDLNRAIWDSPHILPIFSPKEKSAWERTRQLFATVAQANGQIVECRVKVKETS